MPSLPLLKALGLNFSPNQLEVAPGSLVEASNVIIRRDNVIESRRGYALYGTEMGTSTDRCKQLMTYKNKLIRHFANRLQYENGLNNAGVTSFFDFNEIVNGSSQQAAITEAETGLRIKSIEANSNLYLTTSEGIKKISSKSSDAFSATNITPSGGVKALDLNTSLVAPVGDVSGFLPSDSGVAYKVVWGTKDANDNLILGTPSEASTILNPLLELTLRDFSNLLLKLDNVTLTAPSVGLLNGSYYSTLALPISGEAIDLRKNLVDFAEKLDEDLLFASSTGAGTAYLPLNISSVTASSGTVTVNFSIPSGGVPATDYFKVGDKINIPVDLDASVYGFTSGTGSPPEGIIGLNTDQVITGVTSSSIQFIPKDYTNINPVGVSGSITEVQTVPVQGTGDCIVRCDGHDLKTGQKITISGTNSVPSIDNNPNETYTVVRQSDNTFKINLQRNYSTVQLNGVSVTFQDTSDTVTYNSHGLLSGDVVVFTSITTTTGISINTPYYVVNPTTDTFQVSLTVGGSAIALTTDGTGTMQSGISKTIVSPTHYYTAGETVSFLPSSTVNSENVILIDTLNGATVTFQDAGDTVTFASHGLSNDTPIVFSSITTTTGISTNTIYYVINAGTNTFQLAASVGGSALSLATNGSGVVANDIIMSATPNMHHGFSNGDRIQFTSLTTTIGVSINTQYYVVNATPKTFQLSETQGGAVVPLTYTGTGVLNRVFSTNIYYVLSDGLTADSFKISTTIDGAPITISGSGTVAKVITEAGSAGTWNIVVDGLSTAKIESYEFRSIQEPVEPSALVTNDELVSLNEYLDAIIIKLQNFISERGNAIVLSSAYDEYIKPIVITTSGSVLLTFTIPPEVLAYTGSPDANPYFYQIYRTGVYSAVGQININEIGIIQEYSQIEEKYPTGTELTKKTVSYLDITPESIADSGAILYTNERSGEGALQANDVPPFCTDINVFKGYVFFSNTKTRQRKTLDLLGVESMVSSYNPSAPYKLTIANSQKSNTYTFIYGTQEITDLVCDSGSVLSASGSGSYFLINSANDETQYYVWYKVGAATDPLISGKTGIQVVVNATDTAGVVAEKTKNTINNNQVDFSATLTGSTVSITTSEAGYCTAATIGTMPGLFSISTTQQGQGEKASLNYVLLSSNVSAGIAIEETAKSLIRVINKNSNEIVSAFYLSGTGTSPGSLLLEGKNLGIEEFTLLTDGQISGQSFNPDLSPSSIAITAITAIGIGSDVLITTLTDHGLLNGDKIIISNSNSTPSVDGVYEIEYVSSNSFSITPPLPVTNPGSAGAFESKSVAENSSDEEQKHRIYYSKYQQPEAVPILNYLDIGATDRKIIRIFPLRDSLFIFKEDGLYRISGEIAPFSVSLFDSSCILLAPDSLAVSNNQIYGWTTQGVSIITEAGVSIISRPIDTEILKKASSQFTSFKTATWGIGYESDNSYTVYTTNKQTDDQATIGFRYSNLTNSWTTVDKSFTCGLVNFADDKLYLGAGDTNYLEKERKDFTRYDYADRELAFTLSSGAVNSSIISLPTVSNLLAGDVVVQTQTVTTYEFNQLLKKLDLDPGVPSSDYFSSLELIAGENARSRLVSLASKLDADLSTSDYSTDIASVSGVSIVGASIANPTKITTASSHGLKTGRIVTIAGNSEADINGTFQVTVLSSNEFTIPVDLLVLGTGGSLVTVDNDFTDLKVCYNLIVSRLNLDTTVTFSNYRSIDNDTIQEAVIDSVNVNDKDLTLNLALDYLAGPISIFKAIPCSFTYTPITMGDSLGIKHLREATVMFANKAFTRAEVDFSTDLLPELIPIVFNGDGNGIFGHGDFGLGFFGGGSNAAPFRTFIPRQCQRCRYINIGFSHRIAREQFAIYGTTITGEVGQSTRAYR